MNMVNDGIDDYVRILHLYGKLLSALHEAGILKGKTADEIASEISAKGERREEP